MLCTQTNKPTLEVGAHSPAVTPDFCAHDMSMTGVTKSKSPAAKLATAASDALDANGLSL